MFIKEVIFGICGGLGLFIYGIHLMGEGLQKAAGNKLRKILKSYYRSMVRSTKLYRRNTLFKSYSGHSPGRTPI